mgnify:CR=1 FL=1|jgi:hypothetical protein
MNFEVKDIPAKIVPIVNKLKRYVPVIFIVFVSLILGFLITRISTYAQTEPSEDAVTEKLTTVQRPKIDENALKKIEQLEDQNIDVKSLFQQARENPFSE